MNHNLLWHFSSKDHLYPVFVGKYFFPSYPETIITYSILSRCQSSASSYYHQEYAKQLWKCISHSFISQNSKKVLEMCVCVCVGIDVKLPVVFQFQQNWVKYSETVQCIKNTTTYYTEYFPSVYFCCPIFALITVGNQLHILQQQTIKLKAQHHLREGFCYQYLIVTSFSKKQNKNITTQSLFQNIHFM